MQISSIDAQNLRLMAFDVDGVMTDGRIYFTPEGEALKVFNTLDGHGLKIRSTKYDIEAPHCVLALPVLD